MGPKLALKILSGLEPERLRSLAQAIVRDGEGATKFVSVAVEGGVDAHQAVVVDGHDDRDRLAA